MREIFVARADEIADRDRRVIAVDRLELGIFRFGDRFVAFQNRCPHQGGPVCQGRIMPCVEERLSADRRSLGLRYIEDKPHLVCPWHGYEFDVADGQHPGHAASRLRRFETVLCDGNVYVRV